MRKRLDKSGIVYSTNPDFKFETEQSVQHTLLPSQQKLYVRLDRLKGGKMATVVENFIGAVDDLQALAKELKTKCGVGGSAKAGEIILQGEHCEKVLALLTAKGFAVKKRGG